MTAPLALLYTTFPKPSETFLQREAKALLRAGVEVEFYSIWGGRTEFEGRAVKCLGVGGIFKAVFIGLGLLFTKPSIWGLMVPQRWTSGVNVLENWVGLAAGLVWARELKQARWVHAQWGTAPAMAAMAAQRLTGVRWSMGLHAYDLFEHGGDAWLEAKVAAAHAITSSNEAANAQVRKRWPHKGAYCIRRGLALVEHPLMPRVLPEAPVFISVGRLVAKKGFLKLLEILAEFKKTTPRFTALIVGEGPLRKEIALAIARLELGEQVKLVGWLANEEVMRLMRTASLFLFTGEVAPSGDRDGFPNVIGEAMAAGLPVVANNVSGVGEGIKERHTGRLLESLAPQLWSAAMTELLANPSLAADYATAARAWVEENFEVSRNALRLEEYSRGWAAQEAGAAAKQK